MGFDEILSTKKYKVAVDKLRDKARESISERTLGARNQRRRYVWEP